MMQGETAGRDPIGEGAIAGLVWGPLTLLPTLLVSAPAGMAREAWRMAGVAC